MKRFCVALVAAVVGVVVTAGPVERLRGRLGPVFEGGGFQVSCCCLAGIVLLLAVPARVAAATRRVSNAREFNRAVLADRGSGGRIVVLRGFYSHALVVGPRSSAPLQVVGSGHSLVRELRIQGSRAVSVSGVAIRPVGGSGGVQVVNSSRVAISRLTFSAAHTGSKVGLVIEHSTRVHVTGNNFSHCGDGFPAPVFCLRLRGASSTTIAQNRFHDCIGCDFIHGRAGSFVAIVQNRFNRALACRPLATPKCHHDDLIEIFAADVLSVSRNEFGVSEFGGAQLYLSDKGVVDNVRVVNNLFLRTDRLAPGVNPRRAIVVGTRRGTRLPHHVAIINNTILSGEGTRGTSIRLSPRYRLALGANRPVVVNNVIARQLAPQFACGLAYLSTHNVIADGLACSTMDTVGTPHLDPHGRPTADSLLLINKAARRYAPKRDFTGRLRGAMPDIGCYEYPVS